MSTGREFIYIETTYGSFLAPHQHVPVDALPRARVRSTRARLNRYWAELALYMAPVRDELVRGCRRETTESPFFYVRQGWGKTKELKPLRTSRVISCQASFSLSKMALILAVIDSIACFVPYVHIVVRTLQNLVARHGIEKSLGLDYASTAGILGRNMRNNV